MRKIGKGESKRGVYIVQCKITLPRDLPLSTLIYENQRQNIELPRDTRLVGKTHSHSLTHTS